MSPRRTPRAPLDVTRGLIAEGTKSPAHTYEVLEMIENQASKKGINMLSDIAHAGDLRALLLLRPMLHSQRDRVVRAVINLLAEMGHPSVVPALEELTTWHPSPSVRKLAQVTADRLRSIPTDSVTPAPTYKLPPVHECRVGTIDGNGSQVITITRKRRRGPLMMFNLVFNDHEGLKDCSSAYEISASEYKYLVLDGFAQGGMRWPKTSLSYCQRLAREAREHAFRVGRRISVEIETLWPMLEGRGGKALPEPSLPTLPSDQERTYFETSHELIADPVFNYWFFNPVEMYKLVPKLRRVPPPSRARKVYEQTMADLKERLPRVLSVLVPESRRRLLADRLTRQAALLEALGEHQMACRALAAGRGLAGDAPLESQPILVAMVDQSVKNLCMLLDLP